MAERPDKQLCDLLHAYELGMLEPEEARRFEVHLMECDDCVKRMAEFSAESNLLQADPDVERLMTDLGRVTEARQETVPRQNRRTTWVSWTLAAAAVFVVLLLQPWNIDFGTSDSVVAAENRLIVLYMEDLVEIDHRPDLDRIATNLLVSDLTQVSSVRVVSTARMYDLARTLGVDGPSDLRNAPLQEIGLLTRSRWAVSGAIIQNDSNLILTAELQSLRDGDVEKSFRTGAFEPDEIFEAVSSLVDQIVAYLQPGWQSPETEVPVSRFTSTSLEAYGHYLSGLDHMERVENDQAVADFQEALKLDHKMAMAYYHLSRLLDRSLINEAVRYADHAGRVEQYYIKAAYLRYQGRTDSAIAVMETAVDTFNTEKMAWKYLGDYLWATGQLRRAAECYEQTVALDPSYKIGYNSLAYVYDALGEVDSSLAALDRYVAVAPNDANAYDTKGELLGRNGRLGAAIEAFETALRIDPDYDHARAYLGYMYNFDDQYARADSCFKKLAFVSNAALRHAARMYEVYPFLRQGLLDTSLVLLNTALESASTPEVIRILPTQRLHLLGMKAQILSEVGRFDEALEALSDGRTLAGALARPDSLLFRAMQIDILVRKGSASSAAQEYASFGEYLERHPIDTPYSYWFAGARIADAEGHPGRALSLNRRAVAASANFPSRLALARSLLDNEEFTEAEDILKSLKTTYTSEASSFSIESAKIDYYLGVTFEGEGRKEQAVAAYREFLDRWKRADPRLAVIVAARARLERLTTTP